MDTNIYAAHVVINAHFLMISGLRHILYPIDLMYGSHHLRVAGIGGVCVSASHRDKGLMAQMLTHMNTVIRDDGYHLSFLGGQRQRYRNFGWEIAGQSIEARIIIHNLRHADKDWIAESFDEDDTRIQGKITELHNTQQCRCDRPITTRHLFLRAWRGSPVMIRDADGQMAGYAVVSEDRQRLAELCLTHASHAASALAAVMAWLQSSELIVELNPCELDTTREIGAFCESIQTTQTGSWQVLDWPTTLNALLSARAAITTLPDGCVRLGIEGSQAIEIKVESARVSVKSVDATADLVLSPVVLLRVLCGPLMPSQAIELPDAWRVLHAWAPLPLTLPHQDRV